MMYEQSLVKVVEPIKKTTITRLNRGKKWKYGYDKDHDIVVISKTGQIGEVLEIQGLQIALPRVPSSRVFKHENNKWVKAEYPKELSRIKIYSTGERIQTNKKKNGTTILTRSLSEEKKGSGLQIMKYQHT